MTTKPEQKIPEPKMDAANLYREDIFTDRKVGTIRRLLFVGEAQLLTAMGALPLTFEIEAQSLEDAIVKYGPAVKIAFDRAMQEIQEMRRQASSSIVLPERGAAGPGFGPGGLPGGGKIKLP